MLVWTPFGAALVAALALPAPAAAASARATAQSGAISPLSAPLARQRQHTEAERREVLDLIGAEVPDAEGRFATPKRAPGAKPDPDLDWLAALDALESKPPAFAEVREDIEAIRALSATGESAAAAAILEFAFTDVGLIYRDECGRYLRKMSPASLPVLIRASNVEKRPDYRRYALYQLQRLDREEPGKALSNASDTVRIEILEAYGDVLDRSAVLAVLRTVNDVAPAVRAAARATWMKFLTGPEPPPAPKRKLQLPGGKLTDEPQPLWLNHRELADIELRRLYEQLFGRKAPKRANLIDLSKEVFAHYDAGRTDARKERFAVGQKLAGEKKWAEAAAAFDAVLAGDPAFPDRAQMATAYFEAAKLLHAEKNWSAAAIAYGKAEAVDPQGRLARDALAGHHYAHARALTAAGKDATAALNTALRYNPEHPGARAALAGDDPDEAEAEARAPVPWLLYGGVGVGAIALIILLVASRRR